MTGTDHWAAPDADTLYTAPTTGLWLEVIFTQNIICEPGPEAGQDTADQDMGAKHYTYVQGPPHASWGFGLVYLLYFQNYEVAITRWSR